MPNVGLTDLLSKEGRAKRNLQKTIQRAGDKHAQSVDRWKALETLREEGSEEALVGLLRRFSFNYDKTIDDEQEKEWVYDSFSSLGEKALPALTRYMRESDTLAWPLKILERITKGDRLLEVLAQLCEWNDNVYVRDPSKKIQLVHFLGEHKLPAIAQMIVPYLEDVDEGVRFKAVDALLFQGLELSSEAVRKELLAAYVKLLTNPAEESRRIKVRIVECLRELGWELGEHRVRVEQAKAALGLLGRNE